MMSKDRQQPFHKGRGAQINPSGRFEKQQRDEAVEEQNLRTVFLPVHPKSVLNKVDSPDIPLPWSMNPYQGCEHGCVYCYARNTHPFWGYSAGMDFEQKILLKREAPKLLENKLKSQAWQAAPIMLSGNTDCYQPIERKEKITRQLLEILWKYRHPVGLITKNSLILRDIDILKKLATVQLVRVVLSITTLQKDLWQAMEPRTSAPEQRLKAVEALTEAGIPVQVMMAPIIPGLNSHEVLPLAQKAANAGAKNFYHTTVRLNGEVAPIFKDWIQKAYPDRAEKVLQQIRECHGGALGNNTFGQRMRGKGTLAEFLSDQVKLARQKYFPNPDLPPYNLSLHEQHKSPQLRLF